MFYYKYYLQNGVRNVYPLKSCRKSVFLIKMLHVAYYMHTKEQTHRKLSLVHNTFYDSHSASLSLLDKLVHLCSPYGTSLLKLCGTAGWSWLSYINKLGFLEYRLSFMKPHKRNHTYYCLDYGVARPVYNHGVQENDEKSFRDQRLHTEN
jgi:hypothetical protein